MLRKLLRLHLVTRYSLPVVDLAYVAPDNPPIDEPILDDICMAPYYGGLEHDDFSPLMKIARTVQPGIVVELGTAYGNTVANLCKQITTCRIYTVNAPAETQTGSVTTYKLGRDEIGRVYRRFRFEDRVVQIFENTLNLDLGRYLGEQRADLAIVDACHDTSYVINDFLKVQPYVRKGGTILLHDTNPSLVGHLVGSYTACMLLRRKGFDIRQLHDTWWAIWTNN